MHLGKTATLSSDKYRADLPRGISEDIPLVVFVSPLSEKIIILGKKKKKNSCPPCNNLLISTCQTRRKLSPYKRHQVLPSLRVTQCDSERDLDSPGEKLPGCSALTLASLPTPPLPGRINTITERGVDKSFPF